MKYYYNDKLIRTSTHVYTHAGLTQDGKCIACRNGLENAIRAKEAEKSLEISTIRDAKEAIKMLKAGRGYYFYHVGRCQYRHRFEDGDTIEKYLDVIARCEAHNRIVDGYMVVELEAR